jgi:hypothetical protein
MYKGFLEVEDVVAAVVGEFGDGEGEATGDGVGPEEKEIEEREGNLARGMSRVVFDPRVTFDVRSFAARSAEVEMLK